jgi:hypothetical protein
MRAFAPLLLVADFVFHILTKSWQEISTTDFSALFSTVTFLELGVAIALPGGAPALSWQG